MPSIFTDSSGNDYHLTLNTAADWTIDSAVMPNGDNAAHGDGSIAATYNLNGDDFDLADGTDWTVEWWFQYSGASAVAFAQYMILCNGLPGTSTMCWQAVWDYTETMYFSLYNTSGGVYLGVTSSAGLSTSTWHHFAAVKETGNVLKLYVDNVLVSTDNTTTGTVRVPTSAYRLYLGTAPDGTADLDYPGYGHRIGKVAIYNDELSSGRVNAHYLAMS